MQCCRGLRTWKITVRALTMHKEDRAMNVGKKAMAGTMESNDVMVYVSPAIQGLEVRVKSIVAYQFGAQIERVARETAQALGADGVLIELDDRGAVDCTIRARVETALLRAKGEEA